MASGWQPVRRRQIARRRRGPERHGASMMAPNVEQAAKAKLRAIDEAAAMEEYRLRQPDVPQALERGAGTAQPNGRRFKLTRFSEIPWSPVANYLIKDLIPREGLIVVWGPPKCGKSFWTFDALMHVALGRKYRGRRVA